MRDIFSELEFQFALMMGYYTLFLKQGNLNLYLPTGKEENEEYAADWFYEHARGVSLYLQFKNSVTAAITRKTERKEFARNENIEKRIRMPFGLIPNDVFEFRLYKRLENEYQQHNLLHSKSTDSSIGLYVAPIFKSRIELYNNLKSWLTEENYSSEIVYQLFYDEIGKSVRLHQFRDTFSFFKDVIYIQPHQQINDSDTHHYCYNNKRAVSFHSEFTPLKKNVGNAFYLFNEINNKLKKGKTKTILEATDDNLKDLIGHFESSTKSIIRDYRIEQILGDIHKGSKNIFSQLEGYKTNKQYAKYVTSVNKLYQEVFDIQWSFIYPRF